MISIQAMLWGDPFQDVSREDIAGLERITAGYLCSIQALDSEPFDLRFDVGEPRTDPKLLEVEVVVRNLPTEPSASGAIVPGWFENIPTAITENIKHQVERFCDDREMGIPKLKFEFKD